VTEDTGRWLHDVLAGLGDTTGWDDERWDAAAEAALRDTTAAGRKVPGLGHPVHKVADPRIGALFAVACETRTMRAHLRLFEAVGRVHPAVLGRTLPLNGAGIAGAALADLGLPVELLRGFALLARTAGLVGHLAEERLMPIAPAVYAEVDRNAVLVPLHGEQDD